MNATEPGKGGMVGGLNKMTLLLFDIDGTLIHSGGAGQRAMNRTFEHLFGHQNGFGTINMAGRTDRNILRTALDLHGLAATEEAQEAFKRHYFEVLNEEVLVPMPRKRTLPGVEEVLERLHGRADISLGLLTGNWRRSAFTKLGFFGLDRFFEFGAFADDSEERNDLVPFAVRRAEQRMHVRFEPDRVYVIGDTPRDVRCARAHGARSVAVATGPFDMDSLAGEAPDYLFPDMSDVDAFEDILNGRKLD